MTSENAADRPAQGPQTTSENTSGAPVAAFSEAAANVAADQKTRLPKTTTTAAGLPDPFRVAPLLVVDNDPPRSGWVCGTDG
jgi:hypothetical protein